MYLRTVGLFRSDTLRFKGWYWPCGWMCKCLGWPCPATFILLLFEKPIFTLCLLAPRNTWCGNACFGAQVSSKYGAWYSELGSFCNLCALAVELALHIFAIHSADEPQEGRNSCPLLRFYFIGSCHVGVSKCFSRIISLAVYYFSSYICFWLIRSLVYPTLPAFIVCGPLQVLVSQRIELTRLRN